MAATARWKAWRASSRQNPAGAGGGGLPLSGERRERSGAGRVQVRDGCEIWRRSFAGRSFRSTQEEGRGRFERLLCERFGRFAFGLAQVLEDNRLPLVVRR
jgi:hypothetical protein